jgi:heat shock protein HslJ
MKYLLILIVISCTSVKSEEIRTLYIADHLADCTGVSKQKCMLVKENPEEDWTYFYDRISGFDYEEGYTYELRVRVEDVENPPADASSKKYTLTELVAKTPVEESAQDGSELIGTWKVIQMDGMDSMKNFPTFVFAEEENRVSGYAGCNNYFAGYEVNGTQIKFTNAGSTRMMCEDMTVEDAFLKKMNEIAYYKMVKSELHLFDAKDKLIMLAIAEQASE